MNRRLVKPLGLKLIWPLIIGIAFIIFFMIFVFSNDLFEYWMMGCAALLLYASMFCFDVERSFKSYFITGDIKKISRFGNNELVVYGLLRLFFILLNYAILSIIAILILAGMYNLMGQSTFFICASILLAGYFYNRNSDK